jgi:hypothetical protein
MASRASQGDENHRDCLLPNTEAFFPNKTHPSIVVIFGIILRAFLEARHCPDELKQESWGS